MEAGSNCLLAAFTGGTPVSKSRIRLLVEVAPVSYPDHENFAFVVVYLRAHAPISHPDSPNAFLAFYLEASRGTACSIAWTRRTREKRCQAPFSVLTCVRCYPRPAGVWGALALAFEPLNLDRVLE